MSRSPRYASLALALTVVALAGEGGGDPWAPLLEPAGLTPATAQLSSARWTEGGRHRLEPFQRLWDDWRQVEGYGLQRARALLEAGSSLEQLLVAGAAPLGPVGPAGGSPALDLVAALSSVHACAGAPLDAAQTARLAELAAGVPAPVASAAAAVLAAVPPALAAHQRALGDVEREVAFRCAMRLTRSYQVDETTLALLQRVDLPALLGGARGLCAATDRAVRALRAEAAACGSFAFAWDTPLGRVTLHGEGSQTLGLEPMLLAIDSAGDDVYAAGAGVTDAAHTISVLIDLGGDDRYQSPALGDFGVGLLGYGLLVDLDGDDRYAGQGLAQGCGALGVGILLDLGGDDRYQVDEHGQGAATCGLGLLVDLGGDDRYLCLQQAQGYGGVRGAGALVDAAGDDRYEADDADIRRPSPQTREHNTSLAQGCGFGRRAHPGDGHSLAGGEGLLVDGRGDDRYRCGVFGQGAGYWYAAGLLVDLEGDDEYGGVWYAQGAAAHYAVAGLLDLAGHDRYALSHTQGQGHGHDYALGVLCERAGDDVYRGGSNALGAALWNGVGVLRDDAGRDEYRPGGGSLGFAGDARPEHLTLGLFLDRGGEASFPAQELARPGAGWTRPVAADRPRAIGLGAAR